VNLSYANKIGLALDEIVEAVVEGFTVGADMNLKGGKYVLEAFFVNNRNHHLCLEVLAYRSFPRND
jgi:hypothetical protein